MYTTCRAGLPIALSLLPAELTQWCLIPKNNRRLLCDVLLITDLNVQFKLKVAVMMGKKCIYAA